MLKKILQSGFLNRIFFLLALVAFSGALTLSQAQTGPTFKIQNPTGVAWLPNGANPVVAEDLAIDQPIGTVQASDPDFEGNPALTYLYQIIGGVDAGDFYFTGAVLFLKNPLDYEKYADHTYNITVRATSSAAASFDQAMSITITDKNEAPTNIAYTAATGLDDHLSSGTLAFTITGSTDPDNTGAGKKTTADTFTYSINAGGEASSFQFRSGSNLLIETTGSLSSGPHTISIRATDSGSPSLTYNQDFTINISSWVDPTPSNSAPTDIALTPSSINENAGANATVGTLSATDAAGTYSSGISGYALVAGAGDTDNGLFNISGTTLQATASLDYEAATTRSVRIRVTDNGSLTYEESFTININNLNPTGISLSNNSVPENTANNYAVGTFTTTGGYGSLTYALATGNTTNDRDNGSFTITGDTLKLNSGKDFETMPFNPLNIYISSNNGEGELTYAAFTIDITNVNEAPTGITWQSSDNDINENNDPNDIVGTLVATDADAGGSHTFLLEAGTGGADNDSVTVVEATGVVKLNGRSNFEADPLYNIRVKVTDQDGAFTYAALTIDIIDQNDRPTAVKIDDSFSDSIPENSTFDVEVGTLTTEDQDAADTWTYQLSTDGAAADYADNGRFYITGDKLYTKNPADFDYEDDNELKILVKTTDNGAGSLTFDQSLTINLTDVTPEAATDISLTPLTVAEDVAIGTTVGTFTVTDPDAGETQTGANIVHTMELVSISSSSLFKTEANPDGKRLFKIENGVLKTDSLLNLEYHGASLDIRVKVTDPISGGSLAKTNLGSLTYEETFTITITNVNEGPVLSGLTGSLTYIENGTAANIITGITITDVDDGDIEGATISITGNYDPNDVLSWTYDPDSNNPSSLGKVSDGNPITIASNSGGVLVLEGTASKSLYEWNLTRVQYSSTSEYFDPAKLTRTVSFTVNDETSAPVGRLSKTQIESSPLTATINLVNVYDQAYVDDVEDETTNILTYNDNSGAVAITSTLGVYNDDPNLVGATVYFAGGQQGALNKTNTPATYIYVPAEDELVYTAINGITGTFNSGAGELVLTGTATNEQYQAALRSVKYKNSSQTPTEGLRGVVFVVDDSNPANSLFKTNGGGDYIRAIDVVDRENAPFVTAHGPIEVAKGGTRILADADLNAHDPDSPVTIGDGSLTYSITGPSHGQLLIGGQSVSSFQQNVIANRLLSYKHDGSETTTDSFTFTVTDGQYITDVETFNITITGVNVAPVLADIEAGPVAYTLGASPVNLTSALTVTDGNNTLLASATVTISEGFVATTDPLSPNDGLFVSNLTAPLTSTFSVSTGVLTITGSGTVAAYQAALRGVGFSTGAAGADASLSRTIVFQVNDGALASNTQSIGISITAATGTLTPPTGLTRSLDAFGNTVLTWTVGTGATGNQVWRQVVTAQRNPGTLYKTSGTETYELIGTLAGNASTYTDLTAEEGVAYEYAVTAFDATGSTAIPPSSGTPPPVSPLKTPTGLSAVAGTAKVVLTWTDNSSVEDGYKVERSTNGTTWTVLATTNASATSYSDNGLADGTYSYRVRAVDATVPESAYSNTASATVTTVVTGVSDLSGTPTEFALMQNYPNPFNPSTKIRFALPNSANVHIAVYNLIGQEIAQLASGEMSAGYHEVVWDASNVNSGIYFYRIQAGSFTELKKMILMK